MFCGDPNILLSHWYIEVEIDKFYFTFVIGLGHCHPTIMLYFMTVQFLRKIIFMSMSKNLPSLNNETFWAILNEEIEDNIVNQLLWYYLGYRFDDTTQTYNNNDVDPSWQQEYPQPPDFIANRPPTVKLTRSIPKENKQLLKEKLGFKGYKIGTFTPRHTRRSTAVSWLLSYVEIQNLNII